METNRLKSRENIAKHWNLSQTDQRVQYLHCHAWAWSFSHYPSHGNTDSSEHTAHKLITAYCSPCCCKLKANIQDLIFPINSILHKYKETSHLQIHCNKFYLIVINSVLIDTLYESLYHSLNIKCILLKEFLRNSIIYTYYKAKSFAASVCLSAREELEKYCTYFHGVFTNRVILPKNSDLWSVKDLCELVGI